MDSTRTIIKPEDCAAVCIWKVMVGKGWMTSAEIFTALKSCHYSRSTIRWTLTVYCSESGEMDRIRQPGSRRGLIYRIGVEMAAPKPTRIRTTKKQQIGRPEPQPKLGKGNLVDFYD